MYMYVEWVIDTYYNVCMYVVYVQCTFYVRKKGGMGQLNTVNCEHCEKSEKSTVVDNLNVQWVSSHTRVGTVRSTSVWFTNHHDHQ